MAKSPLNDKTIKLLIPVHAMQHHTLKERRVRWSISPQALSRASGIDVTIILAFEDGKVTRSRVRRRLVAALRYLVFQRSLMIAFALGKELGVDVLKGIDLVESDKIMDLRAPDLPDIEDERPFYEIIRAESAAPQRDTLDD
ncbi:hypothetical protein UFOVP469_41 [uncultured Caudovirales phage]|uniref:Uncharacterized protein n=1 Tax=uncultured Caudovirales phage TaxID=2100421 RepID=A0A6J5MGX8_9CAUD|nr:hypothetical protein UFOVP469_41 [uncultured Caudovirales phage]CAB4189733.1 hypothetical protein UFOVP1200_14 [uncultured Caudovirales phage]